MAPNGQGDGIVESLFSARVRAVPEPRRPSSRQVKVSFDQGMPDPAMFPIEALTRCLVETMREDGAEACSYFGAGGPLEMQYGYLGLREALAHRLAERDGRPLGSDGVMVVHGSTDGLALAVNAFLDKGDGAVVEEATYYHTRNFMVATGATVRTVPLDAHGMVVDALEPCLQGLRDDGFTPKMIYTTPTFQSPTTTVLPLERRRRLIAVAEAWNVVVLEDICYAEFRYEGERQPTLRALDEAGLVLQSDSFSKYIAPGLRLAWVAGAPDAIAGLVRVRQDFAVNQVMARAVHRFIASGEFDAHLDSLRVFYRHKRDVTVDALQRYCAPWVRFAVPSGGFNCWLEIAPTVDWDEARSHLEETGISMRPGELFAAGAGGNGAGRRCVRLSFAHVSEEDIEWAIATMGSVLASCTPT
jgi:2-aminoadipate transaminase